MADQTAAYMDGVDAPRAVPDGMRARLTHAVAANALEPIPENLSAILEGPHRIPHEMRLRLTHSVLEDDRDIAIAMADIDAPRPLPEPTAARLEQTLRRRSRRAAMRVYQMAGAAAVAGIVLIAVLVVSNNGHRGPDTSAQAKGAIPTVVGTQPAPTVHASNPGVVLGTKLTRTPSAEPAIGTKSTDPTTTGTLSTGSNASESLGNATDTTQVGAPADGSLVGVNRASSRGEAPATSFSNTGLLGSVGSLIDQLLGIVLGKGSIHGLPADDSSMTAANLARPAPPVATPAQTSTSKSSGRSPHRRLHTRTGKPATAGHASSSTTPSTPAAPKPLITLGGPGGAIITVNVPVSGLSISI